MVQKRAIRIILVESENVQSIWVSKKEGKGVPQSQVLSTSKIQWLYAKGRCVHLPGEVFYQWR